MSGNVAFAMTAEEMDAYYRENESILHSLLKNYSAPHGAFDYEDLLQCAAIGFFKGMKTYNPIMGTKLSTYCYQCADNEVKEFLRKMGAKRRKANVLSLDAELYGDDGKPMSTLEGMDIPEGGINRHQVSPQEQVEANDLAEQIAVIIKRDLTETEQKVIILSAKEGKTQNEIAKILHTSQANISKNLGIARSKIALALKKESEPDAKAV